MVVASGYGGRGRERTCKRKAAPKTRKKKNEKKTKTKTKCTYVEAGSAYFSVPAAARASVGFSPFTQATNKRRKWVKAVVLLLWVGVGSVYYVALRRSQHGRGGGER